MEKNQKKLPLSRIRHVVQVLALVLFAAPALIAGLGVFGQFSMTRDEVSTAAQLPFYGTLSSSQIGPLTVADPFAVLQVICASKSVELSWILAIIPVLVVYGLIRGRAFCGWICPVNLVLELVDWIRQKLHLSVPERVVPRHAKLYIALAVLVLSLVCGVPVFEVISPLSVINKGIVLGSMVGCFTLLAIILAELFWGHRVWCRSLCPLGGCYEALGKVGLVNVKIDHSACIGCDKCKAACLCDPEILQEVVGEGASQDVVRAGDCMLCGKCVDVCPTGCLRVGIGRH